MPTIQEDMIKANELVKNDKVAKLVGEENTFKDYFVVTGNNDDYLVILPNFCTCTHFLLTCIKEKEKVCKHILAARIAGSNIRTLPAGVWQDLLFRER